MRIFNSRKNQLHREQETLRESYQQVTEKLRKKEGEKGRSFDPKTKIVKYDTKSLDWSKALNTSWKIAQREKSNINLDGVQGFKNNLVANIIEYPYED